jgi:outer membrane protein assembly factor BamB
MLSLRQRLASALLFAAGSSALLFGTTGCATTPPAPTYIPFPSLQDVGLTQVWERQIVLAPNETIDHIWRVGDSIYVATNQAHLTRIEAASGVKSWDLTLGNGSELHRPVELPGGNKLLVASRGELMLVNKVTGRAEVTNRLDFSITTDPVVIGNSICVGGTDYFYGLFLDQLGGHQWVTPAFNDGFTAQPAVVGDSLLLATNQGKLWRVSSTDGNWIWRDRKTNGDVTAGLAVDNRYVYIPSLDHYLYAFELADGHELWDARLDGALDQQPVALKGQVLVTASGKGLYDIISNNGQVKWETDDISQIITVLGDQIWAGDSSGNLKSVSLTDGKVISSSPIPGAQLFVPSPDNWIIILNKTGVIEGYTVAK